MSIDFTLPADVEQIRQRVRDFMDAEGTEPERAVPHLGECEVCRRALAELGTPPLLALTATATPDTELPKLVVPDTPPSRTSFR